MELSSHKTQFTLNIKIITSFIRRLLSISSQEIEAWHSQLIKIEAFNEKNQSLQLKSGPEMAIRSLIKGKKVYFLLDWQ